MLVAVVVAASLHAAVVMGLMFDIGVPVSIALPLIVSCLVPFIAAMVLSVGAIVVMLLFVVVVLLVLIVAHGVIWE